MFDLQSDEYENCLLGGLHEHQCVRVLREALSLGSTLEGAHLKSDEDHKNATHVPFSESHSFNLKKCLDIERTFRESANRLPSQPPVPLTLMSQLEQSQRSATVRQVIQQLATNEQMSPHSKRLEVCDGLRRLLSASGERILWESVAEYVALLLALDRLIAGDDSVEVLLDEMDLAVVYCRLQRFEAALLHAARASVLLGRVVHTPFPSVLVERRIIFVRCIAQLDEHPDIAAEQSRMLLDAVTSLNASPPPFSTRLARYAATAAKYGVQSHMFTEALQSVTTGSECVLLYLCALAPSVGMLRRADAELREPAIRHAREKLLLLASSAATKRELDSVNEELGRVVEQLREKNAKLQLALIRAAEEIAATVEKCARSLKSFSFSHGVQFSLCVIGLIHQRASALLQRSNISAAAASTLVSSLELTCGPFWGAIVCADALTSAVGGEVVQHSVLPSVLHATVVPLLDHTQAAGATDAQTFDALLAGLQPQQSPKHGEDSDDEAPLPSLQLWQDMAEGCFVKMYQDDASYVGEDVRIRFAQLLGTLYNRSASSNGETRALALQASMASRLFGPVALRTKAAVAKYAASLGRVCAPSASPSWGVVPHLSTVSLSTSSPHAEIYVSICRSTDRTEQHCVRYEGPVVLDRMGKVTLRAFAEKDGHRSSTIETRYFVQPRSF